MVKSRSRRWEAGRVRDVMQFTGAIYYVLVSTSFSFLWMSIEKKREKMKIDQ